ncbi:MAG: hypothetical protein EA339_03310 [Rhodobacteraceae bacterium]|nr:MAG: hypothetical protein EA339_03310 [Paracoccaceae bacterium]
MINWARVAELYTDFGEDGFAEIVDVFLEEMTESLGRLANATDDKALEAEFHFLKGAALNVGFDEMARICAEGEALASQGEPSQTHKTQLLTQLPQTCDVFSQEWRSKMTAQA